SRVMTTKLRSSGSKLLKSCSYLGVGGDISSIDRCHRSVQDQQLFLARDIPAALRLAFDQVLQVGHDRKIARERVLSNRYDAFPAPAFPNASTCSPSRCRTIQNSSTVSNVSEIEVAAAAPWPPKRGTSTTHRPTFITKASAYASAQMCWWPSMLSSRSTGPMADRTTRPIAAMNMMS